MTITLTPPFDDAHEPDELRRFLNAYRPSDVVGAVWLTVADDVVDLVIRGGTLTRLRIEKDIQCAGHVVAHLVERGRPVTLEEVLEDRTILSYDLLLLGRSPATRTRENQRGILRRLQAVHRGLPWRQPRRAAGERVTKMVQPNAITELLRVEALAQTQATETAGSTDAHADAGRFLEVLSAARARRAGDAVQFDELGWLAARRFAERNGMHLTKPILDAALTYQVLRQDTPAAVLIPQHRLTRRDLDFALAVAATLPHAPSATHCDLLRGASTRH